VGFAESRAAMVRHDLAARGITDPRVLEAMATVPRERFVPDAARSGAYDDRALPIGSGQTISQPYMVAFMAQALELTLTDRVLEVGTGSGYAAAVLSRIAASVLTIERLPSLAARARATLEEVGYTNVEVVVGDGSVGAPDGGSFDAICVSAGAPDVPRALVGQLAPGGRLVVPVGSKSPAGLQTLVRVRLDADGTPRRDELGGVHFVPLVGEQGWRSGRRRG
jgi:protein-L-isoaspartate(D-aspartate) O-methyltransferase